jgi:hypothetical protein
MDDSTDVMEKYGAMLATSSSSDKAPPSDDLDAWASKIKNIDAAHDESQSADAPSNGTLLDQARAQYPILKKYDIQYKDSIGRAPGYLESWPPGETGSAELPRPKEFANDKFGVEVYDKNTSPKDVLADVVSHHLVDVDPKIKSAYEDFKGSLQPFQEKILRQQYEHDKNTAVAGEAGGETRSFEDWKETAGLPAYFRGYTFGQWPSSFNQKAYTPDQMKKLDGVMDYLKSGSGNKTPSDDSNNLTSALSMIDAVFKRSYVRPETMGGLETPVVGALMQMTDRMGPSQAAYASYDTMKGPLYRKAAEIRQETGIKADHSSGEGNSVAERNSLDEDLNSVMIKYGNWRKKQTGQELTPQEKITQDFIDFRNPNSRY